MISFRAMTLSLAIALVAGPALAQRAPKAPETSQKAAPADDDTQALMDAQRRVLEAQEKALEDPAIKKDLESLQALVEKKMTAEDKTVKSKMDRLEKIQGDLQAMQTEESPDPEKAAPLIGEAQKIAMELSEVQEKVLEQPDVKKRLEVFDKKLRAEMKQIDPEVPGALTMLEKASGEAATP